MGSIEPDLASEIVSAGLFPRFAPPGDLCISWFNPVVDAPHAEQVGAIRELPLTSGDPSVELGALLAPTINRTYVHPCYLSVIVLRYL